MQFNDANGVTVALATKTPDARIAAIAKSPEAAFPMTKGNLSLRAALSEDIIAIRDDGTIARLLTGNGLDAGLAEVVQNS